MERISTLTLVILFCAVAVFPQSQLSPAIAKRIADHTPIPLPQTDRPSKSKSDLEDKSVHGRVKNIVEENEYFDETGSSKGKRFRSIVDFNVRGDRLTAVYFSDNGNPYEVSSFGYIDGARVNSYKVIYEDSGVFSGGGGSDEVTQKGGPPDRRYSYKYVYQYKDGKLAGMTMFHNDATKWLSYVYNRTPTQVEEVVYSSNGKINQKYVTVLDSKGNEIEWRNIAVINLPREDRIFQIKIDERDQQGNWTKRTFFKVESGLARKSPYRIEYRTITYFPGKAKTLGKPKPTKY